MKMIKSICAIVLFISVVFNGGVCAYAYDYDQTNLTEVDSLMDEYHSLATDTALDVSSVTTSLYTSTGGTLVLDYVGSYSPFSNVITTKVVYLTTAEVVFYQNALNSNTFRSWLESEIAGAGISYISKAVAAKVAAFLGIPETAVAFLIGKTISFLYWAIDNLESLDLSDAISNSSTGKVKLEFFYLLSSNEPHYMECQNFEPWNSNYVEIPEYYDHKWYENVYDYESETCVHNFNEFVNYSSGIHKKYCSLCKCVILDSCNYTCTTYNATRHKVTCDDCGYMYYEVHVWNIGKNLCLSCGFNTEGSLLQSLRGVTIAELHLLQ